MPSKHTIFILLAALILNACASDKKNSNQMSEHPGNSFSIRELEGSLVRAKVLGGSPCCGYEEAQADSANWGIRLKALAEFLNPPASPQLEPGVDGMHPPVTAAKVMLLRAGEEARDVSAHFAAPKHCQNELRYIGTLSNSFKCFCEVEGEPGKYAVWSSGEEKPQGQPVSRSEALKGTSEELYFRSIHPDFKHYAMQFNEKGQGTKQLGVEVLFWPDGEMRGEVRENDQIEFQIEQEGGKMTTARITLPKMETR